MEVTLTIERGPAQVRRIRLRSPETIIGREKGCDLRIPSAEVSRRHCLLIFTNGQLVVEDLESSNGTFLNQVRVQGRAVVRTGDRLKIGPLTFSVDYPTPSNPLVRPDAGAKSSAPDPRAPTRPSKPAVTRNDDLPIPLLDEAPRTSPGARAEAASPPLPLAAEPIPFQDDSKTGEIANIEFDDSEPLNLPEGEQFRDFLSQMDQ